jgi:hypothetical protein
VFFHSSIRFFLNKEKKVNFKAFMRQILFREKKKIYISTKTRKNFKKKSKEKKKKNYYYILEI